MNTTESNHAPDLTQRPPRSPRVRLGGYAMLARVIDKARASLTGKAGDYKYGNPMDQHFFAFTGIAQDALFEQVKTGAGDWALLLWVNANASPKRAPHEIRAWSAWLETMPVGEAEDLEWFAAQAKRINPARTDLQTIMDYLDADDHVSFGGAA
jgi:hypothetical protein